jgi:hypothetical protein
VSDVVIRVLGRQEVERIIPMGLVESITIQNEAFCSACVAILIQARITSS